MFLGYVWPGLQQVLLGQLVVSSFLQFFIIDLNILYRFFHYFYILHESNLIKILLLWLFICQ